MRDLVSRCVSDDLAEAWPPSGWCDTHVVLGVSSGPDSVAMLRAVVELKTRFGGRGAVAVAHFNHGWRGADSDADQAWLEELCDRLKVPLHTGRPTPPAVAAPVTESEAAARDARYRFLRETAEALGARFVAVAHTADDQVETVLHRILRGTGLDGLRGMAVSRPLSPSTSLVRPLLKVPRNAVLDYLRQIGQDYRLDPSNADVRWMRNRLRHELLPLLGAHYNAAVDECLLKLITQADEAQNVIIGIADGLATGSVVVEPVPSNKTLRAESRVRIDCRQLSLEPALLVREVCRIAWQRAGWPLQAMGFDAWQQLAELIQGQRKEPVNLPGSIRAHRADDSVILENTMMNAQPSLGC
jgi:tRNA(Ile)-lysidine synthase